MRTLCFVPVLCILHLSIAFNIEWSDEIRDDVDKIANTIVGCREMVALNLAVVHGNRTLHANGYGKAELTSSEDAGPKTRFGVASLSKAFAATLLVKVLSEQSKFNLDSNVRDILGEEMYFPTPEMTREATLRDLLAHRTGITSGNFIRMQEDLDRDELVRRIRFLTPIQAFKTSYKYNNLMYGLLSKVTEVIGGDTWENLMNEKIFLPLGMIETNFTHELSDDATDLAHAYLRDGPEWKEVVQHLHSEWGKLGGSGSIISSAEEMANWLKFQLAMGTDVNGTRIVSEDLIEETHTPINNIPLYDSDRAWLRPRAPESYVLKEYALGWRTGFYRGYPLVSHTGTSFGYGALLTLVPDLGIGIYSGITGEDRGYLGRRSLHLYTIDRLLGQDPWLNQTSVCTFPKTTPARVRWNEIAQPVVQNIGQYTGTFGNFAYGNISFSVENNTLMLKYGILGVWEMYQTDEHLFDGRGRGEMWSVTMSRVQFSEFEGGKATQVQLPSLDSRAPPSFQRNLKRSDAPAPPALECTETSSANSLVAANCLLFIVFFFLVN